MLKSFRRYKAILKLNSNIPIFFKDLIIFLKDVIFSTVYFYNDLHSAFKSNFLFKYCLLGCITDTFEKNTEKSIEQKYPLLFSFPLNIFIIIVTNYVYIYIIIILNIV